MRFPATAALAIVCLLATACGDKDTASPSTPHGLATAGNATSPYVPGTVIASFGDTEPFEDFESAERRLGWRAMRPSDQRFRLVRQGGLLVTLPEVGLPRLEQTYAMEGRYGLIEIVQEPEAYELRPSPVITQDTIGPFEGEIWGELPKGSFVFFSGEEIEGQRIRIDVYTNQSSDFTEDDFRAFVASLAFEDDSPR